MSHAQQEAGFRVDSTNQIPLGQLEIHWPQEITFKKLQRKQKKKFLIWEGPTRQPHSHVSQFTNHAKFYSVCSPPHPKSPVTYMTILSFLYSPLPHIFNEFYELVETSDKSFNRSFSFLLAQQLCCWTFLHLRSFQNFEF